MTETFYVEHVEGIGKVVETGLVVFTQGDDPKFKTKISFLGLMDLSHYFDVMIRSIEGRQHRVITLDEKGRFSRLR